MATTDDDLPKWVEEWKENFQTDFTIEELSSLVGKKVKVTRPGDEEGYEFEVVGYSKAVIRGEGEAAEQLSIITRDGKMIQLRTGVRIDISEED